MLARKFLLPLGVLWLVGWTPGDLQSAPWDKPAFTADPSDILKEIARMQKLDPDADVEILLDEGKYHFDEDGHMRVVTRQVYRCLTRNALLTHGAVNKVWAPWYQDRPQIRARVITPDGKVYELDADTTEEIQLPSSDPRIFSDLKMLRAPLPSLTVGAVVEFETTVCNQRPFAESGTYRVFQLGDYMAPVWKVHVEIEAPESLHLSHRVLGIELQPRIRQAEGKRVLVFETGPVQAFLKDVEDLLPSDVSPIPLLVFSTGESWSGVASEYAAIVEDQLRQAKQENLKELVQSVVGKEDSRRKIASRLQAKVQEVVRYTGVAFGRAAIVPSVPDNTLQRGFGDCKDKSTLLVAMLRAAGQQAHVALLKTGPGHDVLHDLPGLSCFDHAIVYVPGDPPLWIDPASEYTPFGQLPIADQGRLALIASESTDALVRTPRSQSSDNRVETQRTIALTETSGTRLVARTEYRGAFAPGARMFYSVLEKKQLEESLKQNGLQQYGSGDLVRFEFADPRDFDKKFYTEAEYDNTNVGGLDGSDAGAFLFPGVALNHLPASLTGFDAAGAEGGAAASDDSAAKPGSKRKSPLELEFPFQCDVRYRIVPPPGFVPTKLPERETIPLGPAQLVVRYDAKQDHSVAASFLLDSGNGRFTPDDVAAVQAELGKRVKNGDVTSWIVPIRFEQTAGKHFEAGRIREAVKEHQRLLVEHPKQAIRHAQFAVALLEVGLGDAARQHARRAVELAPDQAFTHYVLGYALSRDRLGQLYGRGFVREEAAACYRKSLDLDPEDFAVRLELAALLERDEDGIRYDSPETLKAAIAEYGKVYEKLPDENLLDAITTAMYFAGEKDKAHDLLEQAEPTPTRDSLLLAMIAITKGVTAAEEKAKELIARATERRLRLQQLTGTLSYFREYEAAKKLCESLALSSPQPDQLRRTAEQLGELDRFDNVLLPDDDPRRPVQQLVTRMLMYGTTGKGVLDMFVNPPYKDWLEGRMKSAPWLHAIGRQRAALGFHELRIADTISAMSFTSDGDDKSGYRIRCRHKNNPEWTWDWFVVRHDGKYRLLRAGFDDEELGKRAWEHLDKDELDAARRWLDWVADRQKPNVGLWNLYMNPFAGSPFWRIWRLAKEKDEATLRLAVAVASVASDRAGDAIDVLEQARAEATEPQRLQIDRALMHAYATHSNLHEDVTSGDNLRREGLKFASRLADEHAEAFEPFIVQTYFLKRLGQYGELREIAQQRTRKSHNAEIRLLALAHATTADGDLEGAKEHLTQLSQRSEMSIRGHEETAWLMLFQEEVPQDALKHALKAAELATPEDTYAFWSLAAVYAEQGDIVEARQALIATRPPSAERPDRLDNYVLGRIAEQCELREIAVKMYQNVERPKHGLPNSSYDLARRRLAKINPDN